MRNGTHVNPHEPPCGADMGTPYGAHENLALENKWGLCEPRNFHKKIIRAHMDQKCKRDSYMDHLLFAIWTIECKQNHQKIIADIYFLLNLKLHFLIEHAL